MNWADGQFQKQGRAQRAFRFLSGAAVAALLVNMALPQQAYAQIDEMVITATKRETSLQDTPLAVTAFSGDQLNKAGVADLRDIDLLTPNLFIGGNAGFGTTPIALRGIGSLVIGVGAEEGVGVYVDGIFQGRISGSVFEFADVERVEVLRGPQGTLYGRNATGGAINIVTLTPGNEMEARIEVEGTRFDGIGVKGYFMAPIIEDKLSIKVAGASVQDDGFQFNPTRNEDASGTDKSYLSGAINFTPTEQAQIVVRGYYGETETPVSFKNLADGLPLDIIGSDFEDMDKREFFGINSTATYDFGPVEAKAVIGYLETDVTSKTDSDGLPVDNVQLRDEEHSEQFSAEIQLASQNDGRFNWLIAGYYFKEEAEVFLPFNFFRTLPGGPFGLVFAADVETTAYAVFGEGYFDITDRLTFTAGLRYSSEDKDWLGCIGGFTLFEVDFDPTVCDGAFVPDDDSFNAVTPRFVLDYQVNDDLLLYASVTRGFRSGGWNFTEATLPGVDNGFNEEFVWSYEGGVKADFLDNRARVNVAAFYADYSDLQVRSPNEMALLEVSNAGSATIYGVELEFTAQPIERLNISGTVSWLDATYDELTFGSILDNSLQDGAGNRLNRAPEWQGALTVEYGIPLADLGTVTPRVEWQYNGEVFHSPDNLQPFGSDSFNKVNLRLRFDAANEMWGVEAFVDNVNNVRYREHTFQGIIPNAIFPAIISPPRIWGARAYAQF